MDKGDRKLVKGMVEKERVFHNAIECNLIRESLGLPEKTSKAKVLKAAVEFFLETFKDQDFSDVALKPSFKFGSGKRSKKIKLTSPMDGVNSQLTRNNFFYSKHGMAKNENMHGMDDRVARDDCFHSYQGSANLYGMNNQSIRDSLFRFNQGRPNDRTTRDDLLRFNQGSIKIENLHGTNDRAARDDLFNSDQCFVKDRSLHGGPMPVFHAVSNDLQQYNRPSSPNPCPSAFLPPDHPDEASGSDLICDFDDSEDHLETEEDYLQSTLLPVPPLQSEQARESYPLASQVYHPYPESPVNYRGIKQPCPYHQYHPFHYQQYDPPTYFRPSPLWFDTIPSSSKLPVYPSPFHAPSPSMRYLQGSRSSSGDEATHSFCSASPPNLSNGESSFEPNDFY